MVVFPCLCELGMVWDEWGGTSLAGLIRIVFFPSSSPAVSLCLHRSLLIFTAPLQVLVFIVL